MGDEEADEIEDGIADLEPLEFGGNEPREKRTRTKLTTWQATNKYGAKSSDLIVKQEKTKASLANREIIRRLMQDPAAFKTGELNFIAGTAVDKVAKKERWERAAGDHGQGWLETFVASIAKIQDGGGIDLRLTVEKPQRNNSVTVEAQVLTEDYVAISGSTGDGTIPER